MKNYKEELLEKICYTDLVYERINKKLNLNLSKSRIEEMIFLIIQETNEANYQKIGKNVYISNNEKKVRLTINSYTNRIITVDKLSVVP
jgi:FKBP-type peptidyl-prolyl cis-trans isomerase (trigger factor)